jgi:hypothetical protein
MFVTTTKQQHVIINRHHHLRTGSESKEKLLIIFTLVCIHHHDDHQLFPGRTLFLVNGPPDATEEQDLSCSSVLFDFDVEELHNNVDDSEDDAEPLKEQIQRHRENTFTTQKEKKEAPKKRLFSLIHLLWT